MKKQKTLNNEKAYLKLIEDSPDGFIVIDRKGIVNFANKKAKEMLHREPSEIIGKNIGLPLLNEENTEIELARKDGSLRTVELRMAETEWDRKQAYLCNLRDITDRKNTEEELRKHEELIQKTGELAKVGGWEINVHDRSIYWTKTTRLIHEVPDDYEPNLTEALDFFIGTSQEELEIAVQEAIEKGKPYNLVLKFKSAKGNKKWLHVVGIPEVFKQKCIRLWGVIQDITKQKETELELIKSSERFRVALSDTSIVTWQQDKNLRYIWIYNIHPDLDENYVIGKTDEEILTNPEEINQLRTIKQRVLKTGKKETDEVQTTINNKPFYYRLNVEPLRNQNKEIVGITCVSVDITQLKLAYRELEIAKEKAEESDMLKSAFLANISHEIRTPMNGILGFTNLLKKPGVEGIKQKEFVDIIQKSGKRMLNIIDQLIDIAKVESNQINISKEETNINELLDNLYNFFHEEATENGLELKLNKSLPDEHCTFNTDPNKLNQVLTNLIKNAIKFTEKGKIEFGYVYNSELLEFYVADTGIGVEINMKEKIFDRFRQEQSTYTREYEGAGLGLSISKAFIEMLGGEIWMESYKGKGSTFFFTIPVDPSVIKEIKEQEETSEAYEEVLSKKLNILVAEDDNVSYDLIVEMLKNENTSFIRAKNGKEVIELLEKNQPIDVVLMDIKMPIMDGYEATKIIKQKYPDIPVIAQTAFAAQKDREKALNAGCDEVITKPISEEKFFNILHQILDTSSQD